MSDDQRTHIHEQTVQRSTATVMGECVVKSDWLAVGRMDGDGSGWGSLAVRWSGWPRVEWCAVGARSVGSEADGAIGSAADRCDSMRCAASPFPPPSIPFPSRPLFSVLLSSRM